MGYTETIETHLSKEERNTGKKQKYGCVEAQPTENVNNSGSLHRGLTLLFWEVEDEEEKRERDTGHIVEEEV